MGRVQQFYDEHADYEWDRLNRHRMEFAVTMRALADHLPPPPARVLDVGGGPGRYAIALAGQGYRVTLLDLSAGCLAYARERAAEAGVALDKFIHGSALELDRLLGRPGPVFDAVLVMGPLYHLLTPEERAAAVREAMQVLRSGGILAASFISRLAPMRDIVDTPERLVERRDVYERILADGVSVNSTGFTDAYFSHPAEVRPLMEGFGLATLAVIGVEGVTARLEQQINAQTGEVWAAWVDVSYRLGRDPAAHGAADHLLYVGRKP